MKGNVVKVGIIHGSLPSFRSCYGGKILRAAITHYKANRRNTGYNELSMKCRAICCCPKGFPGPAYVGGQIQGYRASTYPASLRSPMRIRQVYLHRLSRLGSWAAILGLAGIRLVDLAASWAAKSYPASVAG